MRWFTIVLAVLSSCGGGSPSPASLPTPAPARASAGVVAPTPSGPVVRHADYPASRRDAVTERLHSVDVSDPYRWLEDAKQPEVQAWMQAQDAYARSPPHAAPPFSC